MQRAQSAAGGIRSGTAPGALTCAGPSAGKSDLATVNEASASLLTASARAGESERARASSAAPAPPLGADRAASATTAAAATDCCDGPLSSPIRRDASTACASKEERASAAGWGRHGRPALPPPLSTPRVDWASASESPSASASASAAWAPRRRREGASEEAEAEEKDARAEVMAEAAPRNAVSAARRSTAWACDYHVAERGGGGERGRWDREQ